MGISITIRDKDDKDIIDFDTDDVNILDATCVHFKGHYFYYVPMAGATRAIFKEGPAPFELVVTD